MRQSRLSLWDAVSHADRDAALRRVERLRKAHPKAGRDALHKTLVRSKCLQAGAVGALSALTGAIPGVGRLAAFALGPLADTALVSVLQAELVLETFALYDFELPPGAEKMAVLGIAATNIGADEIAKRTGQVIAETLGKGLAARLLIKAWPLAKIGTAAATNIAVTYAIGSRAQKLCKMREASLKQWPELMRSAVMINPTQLTDWATKSARTAVDQAFDMMRGWRERMTQLAPTADVPLLPETDVKPKRKRIDVPVAPTRKAAAKRRAPRKAAAKKRPS
ncbi:MAG TPA: hypothetical protein VN581_12175 [Patescibacteria group bacterium]|nr:hypothetical protein [Patescibacteria group bacterium]